MTNTLLISEKYVKTQSNIQDNVWGDFLTPAIREAQDIELQPIIGRPLYKKILKEVEEKDVEERFKTLIEDWIQPYLLYQTIVSLIPIIGTKLGNIGTVISNDEHVQNISSSERENLEYRYRYLADHYKSELQKYLLANKDLYPELTSTCLKNLNLKSSNSLPLWTGGVRHGQRETTDCPDKADYADPDGRKAGYIEGGKTVSVTKNNATTTVLPSEGYEGFSSVDVEVNVPIQDKKTVEVTSTTGTTTITPDEGYDGMKEVELNINATTPQILLNGQTLSNSKLIMDGDNVSIKNIFNFNNITTFDNMFNNFSIVNKNNKIIFDGDFSFLGEIKNVKENVFNNIVSNRYKTTNYSSGLYKKILYCEIDLPNVIIGENPIGTIISAGNFNLGIDTYNFLKFDINKIDFKNIKIARKYDYLIGGIYTDDPEYFKDFVLNDDIDVSGFSSGRIFNGDICLDMEKESSKDKYLNLNYLFKDAIKTPYNKIFNLNSENLFANIDISDTIWNTSTIFDVSYEWSNSQYLIKKIKVSKKTFSDTTINTYKIIRGWLKLDQDFFDALPQNTTSRTIKLSSNTMNALTDEMKATAANKNWTLTT